LSHDQDCHQRVETEAKVLEGYRHLLPFIKVMWYQRPGGNPAFFFLAVPMMVEVEI
jgi:hypothetical protein